MKNKILPFISLFLLCLIVTLSLFLTGTAENYDLTVYLSASGNAENSGLTENAPVSTFTQAIDAANTALTQLGFGTGYGLQVRFVLLDDLTVSSDPYGKTPFAYKLTVTGKTGTETVNAKGTYIHHMGDTTYENLHIAHIGTSNYAFLCGNGYDLVLGKGLTCTPNQNGHYLNVAGGVYGDTKTTFVSDSKLTVLSGSWETLYAGSYKDSQTGNATMYAENCKIYANAGTCYTKTHTGTSTITLKNCEVAIGSEGMLQGGPHNAAGKLTGKLTLTVENCKVRDFGVGFKSPITAPLELTVKDTCVEAAYSVTATGEKSITLCATPGNTLDLTPAKTFEATDFIGGGTLVLGDEGMLVADRVTGSTALSFGKEPLTRAYVRASASTPDSAFTYNGESAIRTRIDGESKIWTFSSAVTMKVPENVTLTLHTGFDGGSEVLPDSVSTEAGVTSYTFYGVSTGNYRYVVKGTGYYQVTKNLLLTREKLEKDLVMDCTPPLRAGTGFEPNPSANPNVKDYTDEMRRNFLKDDPSNWPEYSFIFDTPYFTRDSYETGVHQATTQEEMLAYVEKCVAKSENLYLYSLGKSPAYGFEIPIVIFTSSDLSGAKSLEEAAEICNANGKLNVQYQAQVHGNEPAGGEGALAMIGALSTSWGDQYRNDLNICIIPRINTDGSYTYTRNQVTNNRNLNRDYLLLEADEIPMIINAYNLFEPELVVDGHEFTVATANTSGAFNDAMLATGGNESADPAFENTGVAMILQSMDNLAEKGLTSFFYTSVDDSTDPSTARAYYQMRGSVSLLLETSGIHTGQNGFHRRVVTQFVCMETYLNYAKTNRAALRALSAEARSELVENGSSYSADRILALKTTTVNHPQTYPGTTYDYSTGLATGTKARTAKSTDNVTRSRPLPTAYILPKDENSEAILRVARVHAISFYELASDTAAYVMGYQGSYTGNSVTNVTLTEESLVSFPNGAYVFPMNQESALILAAMFEPDNDDIYNTSDKTFTLAQKGMIPYQNGSFAMFRSQRTLTDGMIEAIPAPSAPTELSVTHPQGSSFVGTVQGLDPDLLYEIRHESESVFSPVPAGSTALENVPFGFVEIRYPAQGDIPASKTVRLELLPPATALPTVYLAAASGSDLSYGTENSPVKTVDRAISLLNILQRYSDQKATLIFAETLNTTVALDFPAYDFPLYITSKSGEEGIRSSKNITFGGETAVDDFTFTYTATGYVYIVADGNKLTLGEKVKSVGEKGVYYMPTGGGHERAVESTHMTVLAGTWRNIYVGGYRGSVAGDAVLIAKNCTVVSHVQNSYTGKTEGNVSIDLENVTVQTSLLCGNAALNNVSGNVTLLAKNCNVPALYAGSRDAGDVNGKVQVTLENCTAGDLIGTAKNETGTVGESHLTLLSTTPTGTVEGWTSVNQGAPALKGDVDKSGAVDLNDAIYLLYHVNFPGNYPIDQEVDLDGNGQADLNDAIYLLYHVNFPSSYPLH